jgi:hypothetical protein
MDFLRGFCLDVNHPKFPKYIDFKDGVHREFKLKCPISLLKYIHANLSQYVPTIKPEALQSLDAVISSMHGKDLILVTHTRSHNIDRFMPIRSSPSRC